MRTYYATADLVNGLLEVFSTKEEAEKALAELIEEGNAINESNRDELESEGLEVPDANDLYSVVEVDEHGNVL